MRLFLSFLISVSLWSVAPSEAASGKEKHELLPKPTTIALAEMDAKAPWGWTDFCTRHRDECETPSLPAEIISLRTQNWDEIQRINLDVNTSIREATDLEVYGVVERWEYPTSGAGDCEDFALEKRRRLMDMGFPRQALLMTVVTDENGFGHAILVVRTDRGDYALDNRTNRIVAWSATGYGFVKQQAADNPNHWVRLGDPASPTITATAQH